MSSELTSNKAQNNFKMRVGDEQRVYEFEDFRLDADKRLLFRNGRQLPLTPKVVETLLALIERRGLVVSKDELMEAVWPDAVVEESNLSQNLYLLRKELGSNAAAKPFIETLRRRGYRFDGDVRIGSRSNGSVPDTPINIGPSGAANARRVSRGIVRRGNVVALTDWREGPLPQPVEPIETAAERHAKWAGSRFVVILGLGVVAAAILLTAYRFFGDGQNERKAIPAPFAEMTISRLTTSGKATHAAISPDGKYVAHSSADPEGDSLWVRHVTAPTAVRVAGPAAAEFVWVAFAPDGDSVYYVALDRDKGDTELLRVPVLGGPSSMIGYDVGPVGFSPDGKQITYVRSDQGVTRLFVANADASGERALSVRKQPEYFWGYWNAPAWSPDGRTIAVQVRRNDARGQYETILGVNVEDGAESALTSARWNYAGQPVWLADGQGLLVTASESTSAPVQVWHIAVDSREATRVTNDLNNYHDLSLTADSKRLVAVQDHSVSSIWVAPAAEAARAKRIATETGLITDIAWMPDGRIVYRSNAGGDGEIWVMNADGSGSKQLTVGARASRGLAITRDGRFILFASDRGGRFNIWRVNADGSGAKQLTDSDDNFYPHPTPDGAWVLFQRDVLESRLWKVPVDGGDPVRLTDTRVIRPVVSPDGKMIAYHYLDPAAQGSRWSVGLISIEGGPLIKRFDLPTTVMPAERLIRWAPSGAAIAFPNSAGGHSDIWLQPLDGRPSRQLTDFQAERIIAFDWSADASSLAIVRGVETSDVILIDR